MENKLNNISYFIKKNKIYSDFNLVNDYMMNLNFSNLKNKNQFGGNGEYPLDIDQNQMQVNETQMPYNTESENQEYVEPGYVDPGLENQAYVDPNQAYVDPNQAYVDPNQAYVDPNQAYADPGLQNQAYVDPALQNPEMDNMYNAKTTKQMGIPEPTIIPDNFYTQSAYSNNNGAYDYNNEISQPSNLRYVENTNKSPDLFLNNPGYTSDKISTYTIPVGTILYHSTEKKRGFNTNYIKFGNDKIITFFTPNFRLASDKIEGCSINKQHGYIHAFKVIKEISNIYIKLPYDNEDDLSLENLNEEFCS